MMDEKEKDVLQNEAAEQENKESAVQEVKEAEPQQTGEAQEPKEAEGDAKEKAAAAANEAKEKAAQAADKAVDKAKELAAKTDALPKKKKMILGAVAVVVILLLIKGVAGGSPFDRIASDMLKQYPFANNAKAEDGSYLKLDTNPYDKDADDMDYVQLSTFYDIQSDTLEGIKYWASLMLLGRR